jgi:hypothetical protein
VPDLEALRPGQISGSTSVQTKLQSQHRALKHDESRSRVIAWDADRIGAMPDRQRLYILKTRTPTLSQYLADDAKTSQGYTKLTRRHHPIVS